ncbi:SRPBCC family protein [Amycolatopsis sp. FDAARGOS 1241]|uniref:SRPBCC family protein n=1 Tax=Amycolatopsis sp. FDAARGOS 1241 TaxID=2778070 RepID=UPI00194DD2B3|nr:SRPBCC family protein [Amycolatopsis sp. FDAARGOS 1241]QRP44414.1 SRPBCC family protein [Amycolatopsis sp. FDAARGOS 1241]
MRLDHEFTVPAPLEEVWQAVIDPERVAPCMPGATLTKVEGDSFTGTVKVKLGPISLLYKGSGEFLEKDEAARKVVIKASGKDSRGGGTAAATVTVTLRSTDDGGTHGDVASDIAITGRPAQFGRGLISEVGGKILDTFADNLANSLKTAPEAPPAAAAPAPAAAAAAAPASEEAAATGDLAEQSAATAAETAPKPQLRSVPAGGSTGETEAIDLLDYAGQSVAKRLIPVAAGAAVLFVILMIIRAVRKR